MSALFEILLKKLDVAVCRWPSLELQPPIPPWLQTKSLDLTSFPFLESMLFEVEPAALEGEELGPWEQDEQAFSAEFLKVEEGWVLLLKRLGQDYQRQVEILQRARDNSLAHEALTREIEKKNYLLHCIVHDLAGPLTSIKGAFQLLESSSLPPENNQELFEIGLRQCGRQESMIREILDVFAAEVNALEHGPPHDRAELSEVAQAVVRSLRAAFVQRNLTLRRSGSENVQVVGERAKLERVLSNLVENALRNAADGSEVEVAISHEGEQAKAQVLDRGPGVPEDVVPSLFQALSKGRSGGGKIGLGLYFCRLTVESWGGRIGYRPRPGGGSDFWFTLPVAKGSIPARGQK